MEIVAHPSAAQPRITATAYTSCACLRLLYQPHFDSGGAVRPCAGGDRQPAPVGRSADCKTISRAGDGFSLVRCGDLQLARGGGSSGGGGLVARQARGDRKCSAGGSFCVCTPSLASKTRVAARRHGGANECTLQESLGIVAHRPANQSAHAGG